MKKMMILFILIAIIGLVLASCEKDVVTYCPFCGQTGIKEVSIYDKDTGLTEIYYKCTNNKCGKTFGAGKI